MCVYVHLCSARTFIYVSDATLGKIFSISLADQSVVRIDTAATGVLNTPRGIALDRTQTNLYISDCTDNNVSTQPERT
jgi:6-phosphogluconolactonase (cycloisomerase 2 family)